MKKQKQGRPAKPPSTVLRIPVSKIAAVEKLLGKTLGENQKPHIMVRVPVKDVARIKKIIHS